MKTLLGPLVAVLLLTAACSEDETGAGGAGGEGPGSGGQGGGAQGGGGTGTGGSGGGACVDPDVSAGWTITLPTGETFAAGESDGVADSTPIAIDGEVTLDGDEVVVTDAASDPPAVLRFRIDEATAAIPEGARVAVSGSVSDVIYPGSPDQSYRLALRVDNAGEAGDPIEAGSRAWLLFGGSDVEPFTVTLSDSCEIDFGQYQSTWLVASEGAEAVEVAEGDSADLEVASGPHAGAYTFHAFNTTLPLEGSHNANFLIVRAD